MFRRRANRLVLLLVPAAMIAISLGVFSATVRAATATQAQSADPKTVWDGVYTSAQANRGLVEYQASCSGCHRGELDGDTGLSMDGRLRGDGFMKRWMGTSLDGLFTALQATMPPENAGGLSAHAYLDIVALLLRANSFPAGDGELRADLLGSILIEGEHGPEPLPSFSFVQLVGCLTKGADDTWHLTHASEPVRTTETDQSTPEEWEAAEAKPLGTQTFRLQNFEYLGADFSPLAHRGHKMQTKGVLIRVAAGDRIQLTLMEMLAPSCDP